MKLSTRVLLLACLAVAPITLAAPPAEDADRQARVIESVPAVAEAVAACETGAWREIAWREDADAALAEAGASGKPLLVFVYKTLEADAGDGEPLVCLGAQITRGTAYADEGVRSAIEEGFVPLQVDIAGDELPEALSALRFLERAHAGRDGRGLPPGFSVSAVLSPDGEAVLATSLPPRGERRARAGGGEGGSRAGDDGRRRPLARVADEAEHNAERYRGMLTRALETQAGREAAAAEGDAALRAFDPGAAARARRG